jgi:outer membrane protein assembly factor BamB
MTRRAALAGILGAGLTGCLQLQQTDGEGTTAATTDAEGTGATETATTQTTEATETTETTETTVANQVELSEAWTSGLESHNVAVGDELVYAAHPDTGVVAFDRASGERAWTALRDHELGHVSNFLPSLTVLVPTSPAVVLGRNGPADEFGLLQVDDTGAVVGRRDIDGKPSGLAATSAGLLLDVAKSGEHEVERDSSSSYCQYAGGTVEWLGDDLAPVASFQKPAEACQFELLGATGQYAVFSGAYMRGIHGDTGETWQRNTYSEATAVAADGKTFSATGNEGLLRLDQDDGSTLWSFTGYSGARGAATDGDSVYLAATGLSAVSASDGSRRWRTSLDENPVSDPVVTDRGIWLLTGESLALFDPEDGTRLHRSSAPAVDRNVRLLATGSEVVVASEGGISVYDVEG